MRVTLLGSFANFVLLVFKFVAGMWGHSSAMIADAVHSLSGFRNGYNRTFFCQYIFQAEGREP